MDEELKLGDKRNRTAFLYIPKRLEGEWRWWQEATFEEEVQERIMVGEYDYIEFLAWCAIRWVD